MVYVSDYIYKALHSGSYIKVFANLYEIFTDEERYDEERYVVYGVIDYMKIDGFSRGCIARWLDDLFRECAEFGVVDPEFKRTVYCYLKDKMFI